MASAYKSALRSGDQSDSDVSDEVSNGDSSATLQEESDQDSSSGADDDLHPKSTSKHIDEPSLELRNRVLMLTSRGVSHRHRHLLTDLHSFLPHSYRETKLDTKSSNNYNSALNGLADLQSCNYVFFLEARKQGQDLYLWMAKAPNGPTIKFSVSNIHTMGELSFGGNCLKGSRGVVVFDKSFEDQLAGNEHKSLIREMLRGVFCVPSKNIKGMKPFVDRVVGIYGLDGKIWIRVYEIREGDKGKTVLDSEDSSDLSLVEVGPRFVLTPVVILEGSFGGPVIFENKQFVSPNQLRTEKRLQRSEKYAKRKGGTEYRVMKRKNLGLESGMRRKASALDDKTLFG